MPGRKMKAKHALITIFLPDIFLFSIVCTSGQFGIEVCPYSREANEKWEEQKGPEG
jgi:hypothetical protein